MEGCHVIIFISQNRNPNFPQTLAATIHLNGRRRQSRRPSHLQPPLQQLHRTTIAARSTLCQSLATATRHHQRRREVATLAPFAPATTNLHLHVAAAQPLAHHHGRRRPATTTTLRWKTRTKHEPPRLHLLHSRNLHVAASSPQRSYNAPPHIFFLHATIATANLHHHL